MVIICRLRISHKIKREVKWINSWKTYQSSSIIRDIQSNSISFSIVRIKECGRWGIGRLLAMTDGCVTKVKSCHQNSFRVLATKLSVIITKGLKVSSAITICLITSPDYKITGSKFVDMSLIPNYLKLHSAICC